MRHSGLEPESSPRRLYTDRVAMTSLPLCQPPIWRHHGELVLDSSLRSAAFGMPGVDAEQRSRLGNEGRAKVSLRGNDGYVEPVVQVVGPARPGGDHPHPSPPLRSPVEGEGVRAPFPHTIQLCSRSRSPGGGAAGGRVFSCWLLVVSMGREGSAGSSAGSLVGTDPSTALRTGSVGAELAAVLRPPPLPLDSGFRRNDG